MELASFSPFSLTHQSFLDQLTESIGLVLNTIEANTLTENLLTQAQSLAEELRSQQEELRETNEDLGRQAKLLADQNIEAEQKNQEVEQSKRLVEEKAGQLAISSKYKSEFIANMSHELRTPLNSLLILAQQLEENPGHNLTDTQVEYASVIRASGNDLLRLLNNILDLAKVESGTVVVEMAELSFAQLQASLVREFEHVAKGKALDFAIDLAPDLPDDIVTDPQRLRQILMNLLSNAFKFTDHGQVHVQVGLVDSGWSPETASLAEARDVVALSVEDSGIGIEKRQQQRIFESFAQGDGTTARLYGGTGLGLSISRELVALLGGEITVSSEPGYGSTFTVFLPLGLSTMTPPADTAHDEPIGEQRPAPPGVVAGTTGASQDTITDATVATVAGHVAAAVATSVPATATGTGNGTSSGVDGPGAGATSFPARQAPASGGGDLGDFSGTKVLVVDDDYRNSFALTAFLERRNAEVLVAENGSDAVALVEHTSDIDIVLMDIMMPLMDGYETMRAIRSLDHATTLPIIAVTGKVMPGERQRCIDAGATDYIPKPVDTEALVAVLKWWLDKARMVGP